MIEARDPAGFPAMYARDSVTTGLETEGPNLGRGKSGYDALLKWKESGDVTDLAGFAVGGGHNTMRLNFSYCKPEVINEGISRLGVMFKEELRKMQPIFKSV